MLRAAPASSIRSAETGMWQAVLGHLRRSGGCKAARPARCSAVLALCALSGLSVQTSYACAQPTVWSVASAFDLAARNLLPAGYPQPAAAARVPIVPATLLKAVGWVESGWRQFDRTGRPLVSGDFGYGV